MKKLKEIYVFNINIFGNKNIIQNSEEDLRNLLFGFTGSENISTRAYLQTQKGWPLKTNLVRWKIIILSSIMEQNLTSDVCDVTSYIKSSTAFITDYVNIKKCV